MNFLQRLAGVPQLLKELNETKAVAAQYASRQLINSSTTTYATWDVFSGKDRFLTNGDVYAVIKKMYEACARLPMYTYEVSKDETKRKAYKRLLSLQQGSYIDGASAFAIKACHVKALEAVDDDDPVESLLNKPNPYQTRTEFLEALYYWRIKEGKFRVALITLDGGANQGKIMEMYILQPNRVGIKKANTFPNQILGFTYQIPGSATTIDIDVDDMIMANSFNPEDEFDGLSPLRPGSRNIQRGEAGEDVSVRQLQNGGIPGIVYNEGVGSDEIGQPELDLVREAYNGFVTNPNNKGKLFWAAGKVGVAATGSTLTDLAVIDGEEMSFNKFCRVMGISPLLFGVMQALTLDNFKEAKKDAYTSTYLPIAFGAAMKLTQSLCNRLTDKQRILNIDMSGISELQEDMAKMFEAVAAMPVTLTGNEQRAMWNYERSDASNMDIPLVKSGYATVESLTLEPAIIPE